MTWRDEARPCTPDYLRNMLSNIAILCRREDKHVRISAGVIALALQFCAGAAPSIIAVNIDGVIHPITAALVNRAIDRAKTDHPVALLVRLNTPCGLPDATRQLA